MAVQYDLAEQKKVYAKWAPIYDAVYVKLLADAQRKAANAAAACGPDILEVGVGTGLVLSYYPRHCRVTGIDLSFDMLEKAVEKKRERRLSQVGLLASMDACALGFADASFNAVTVPFVITLVPDPEGALDEMRRVLKPGGEIIIASKLGADAGPAMHVESMLAPLVKKVGWSIAFKASRLRTWAATHPDMTVSDISPVFPAGFFKMVRIKKAK
ncbi:class I SAM-dependent methyltransferase [Azorhizobium doebereinerae]|uniref:class I SAM-dependent methyltransferase n=1 Tax=Azorhizobium doebereinerae TaxID=281091 RepID=UPI00040C7B3A|nr:class I SAM-dependent methyltransferase [Azorhizobium doebereinerae]